MGLITVIGGRRTDLPSPVHCSVRPAARRQHGDGIRRTTGTRPTDDTNMRNDP